MIKFELASVLVLLCVCSSAFAQETKVDRAIRAVKELCLTGTQFDLKADARGNLTLRKLLPGGEGAVSVNVRESSGSAAIFDEKIRQIADEDIRRCIQPYIQQIIEAILVENPQSNNRPQLPTEQRSLDIQASLHSCKRESQNSVLCAVEFKNDSTKRIGISVNTQTAWLKEKGGDIYQSDSAKYDGKIFRKGIVYTQINPEESKKCYISFIVKQSAKYFDELEISMSGPGKPKFTFNLLK